MCQKQFSIIWFHQDIGWQEMQVNYPKDIKAIKKMAKALTKRFKTKHWVVKGKNYYE